MSLLLAALLLLLAPASPRLAKRPSLLAFEGYSWLEVDGLARLQTQEQPAIVLFHAYTKPIKKPGFRYFSRLPREVGAILPDIRLYTFDCFAKPTACADLNIKQYPTMMLFANRQRHVFRGPYDFDDTEAWLEANVAVHSQAILDEAQVRRLLEKAKTKATG